MAVEHRHLTGAAGTEPPQGHARQEELVPLGQGTDQIGPLQRRHGRAEASVARPSTAGEGTCIQLVIAGGVPPLGDHEDLVGGPELADPGRDLDPPFIHEAAIGDEVGAPVRVDGLRLRQRAESQDQAEDGTWKTEDGRRRGYPHGPSLPGRLARRRPAPSAGRPRAPSVAVGPGRRETPARGVRAAPGELAAPARGEPGAVPRRLRGRCPPASARGAPAARRRRVPAGRAVGALARVAAVHVRRGPHAVSPVRSAAADGGDATLVGPDLRGAAVGPTRPRSAGPGRGGRTVTRVQSTARA